MLKISNSSGVHLKAGCFDSFLHLKELGYNAVDYQAFCTDCLSGLYTYDDKRFEEFLLRDKSDAEKLGLEIIQTHGLWPFDDRETELWQKKFDAMVKSIKGSAILGAEYVVIHPVMPTWWNESPHHDEDVLENIEYMRKLVPYAKEYGVKIALENMPSKVVPCGTIKELIDCIDTVDSEFLVACFDTGHCHVSEDVGEMTRKLSDRLKCLHIHDNDGTYDSHKMPYTSGTIDWDDFLAALRDIHYTGVMNLECNPDKALPPEEYLQQEIWLKNMVERMAKQVSDDHD